MLPSTAATGLARFARVARVVPWAVATVAAVGLAVAASGCADLPHYGPSAHTYYVSPSGHDGDSGTSAGAAWQSLARVQQQQLRPGDQILLQGGARYSGTLTVAAGDAGNAGQPVVIGSYGSGNAVLASSGDGIDVHNTGGVAIRDLTITGVGAPYAHGTGINLYSDLHSGAKPNHVTISGVDVSGFQTGIGIGSASYTGFAEVAVHQARLHGNEDSGLKTYGPDFEVAHPAYANQNIDIEAVQAYDNAGDPAVLAHSTGNGISLGSVSGAKVSGSTAYNNGFASAALAHDGPVGIWTYNSTGVVIEHNTAYANHTASLADGAGFGMDDNVSNSTIQYNLAFHNDGPGIYVYTDEPSSLYTGDTIRYNISNDDGRKMPQNGGLTVYGTYISGLDVYQNTVVMAGTGGQAPALLVSGSQNGITIRNNVLATDGSPLATVLGVTASHVVLQGNDYYAPSGLWYVIWSTKTYTTLADWRAATGAEKLSGQPTGLTVDPCFSGGRLPEIRTTAEAQAIVPACTNLAGKGLDLQKLFQTNTGTTDYFGRALSTPPPVGAAVPVVPGSKPGGSAP
ncbi:hypothetical protein ABIA35_006245 [Catenulispora sp. MAP12-49]|uniref:right-handed parallel beta-helix repeat-containing protein n=1 Tax=Catenulispora sp. MAP12-49 TaxID=3156302 RepID=UPI003512792C